MITSTTHRIALRTMIVLVACAAFHAPSLPSAHDKPAQAHTSLTNESYRPFLINNIFNYYGNNGDGSYNRLSTNNEGFEFPKGSGQCIMFEDGLLWGGFHKGRAVPKVGGSAYRHALQAGTLLTGGTPSTDPVAVDATDPKYRMYCVRPDIRPDVPFSAVEALLDADEVPYVGRYETVTAHDLYDRYIADWNAWPAADGAPYTDVNTNGVYDPAVDIPGQPGADQTLWFAANDMHQSRVNGLAGCPPIGLEVHRTIWGYKREGALGNTIFISTVLINKSGAPVDSMYFAQFADPDLGFAGDDYVGCDTTLGLGYVYNGLSSDFILGTAVPAAGFVLVQGPKVPGTPVDTALFLGARRQGFRNLLMSSFALFGFPANVDPAQGPNGDVQWYRIMKGTNAVSGVPFTDPNTSTTTPFCVSGDPVKATDGSAGWVDGQGGTTPGDRRFAMATGPFTLADGDTQQIVVACLASRGADRLSSITALRSDVRAVQRAFRNTFSGQQAPLVSCKVSRNDTQAMLAFRLDARNSSVTAASLQVTTVKDSVLVSVPLNDDGAHGDGAAGDGVWGGSASIPAWPSGLMAAAVITGPGNELTRWDHVLDHITTARLSVASFDVASDNLNSNGVANPGENVRFVFALRNDSPFSLSKLVTRSSPVAGNGTYIIGTLTSHAAFSPQYNANDPESYFVFDVPAGYPDTTFRVAIVTTDDSMNVWRDTLAFPVRPPPGKAYGTPLLHEAGKSTGAYTIQIVDPAHVKDHTYVLRGADSTGILGRYTLKDSTLGVILLQGHDAPDPLGHTSPVVDGFKVLRGTIDENPGMASWDVPQGTLRFSPHGGFTNSGLEGFTATGDPTAYETSLGTIGSASNFAYGGIGTDLGPADDHTVLLKLAAVDNVALWDPKAAPADTNYSRAYRYLRSASAQAALPSFTPWIINKSSGYPYQDYNYAVPFSAWDMDMTPPQRLAVGHFENNTSYGRVDGRYWPNDTTGDNSLTREFAFIFRAPYTETPDTALTVNLSNNTTTPLMWVIACARRAEERWVAGDQFTIVARHFPTMQDAWVFNPAVVGDVLHQEQPSSFALMQNYPNPFNPSTTIRYELPAQGTVTVTVFDVLGRAVRHLVHEVQPAGAHAITWGADNDAGARVASGVYFYRCTVERSDRGGQFDQTMKMILLR